MQIKPTRTILVTGFTPFGGEKINPSWQIVKALPELISGFRVEKLRVPTEFGKSINVVTKAIDKLKPNLVLCLGQAGGRAYMSLERVAINVDDARIADNAGAQPIDEAIADGAPAAYFCTLPIKAMVASMTKKHIPAEISNTAGTFVCNHLIFGVLHHIAIKQYPIRAGFMHVPFLDSQVVGRSDVPSMPLLAMIDGTKAAIIAAIKYREDIKSIGGALH
jgi:pyroglutamyl-peptidase